MNAKQSPRRTSKVLLFFLWFGSCIYLYASLFHFPAAPFLLGGDQVYFWMHALQMVDGERIYRDFFQFTPPGTDIVYFGLFRVFGPRIVATNVAVFLLGMVLCAICFRLARQILDRRSAVLACALFLTLIYGRLLNATHHWFSMALILVAVILLMPRRTPGRTLMAGALVGVAAFFTQSHAAAALLGFMIFLLWERHVTAASWNRFAKQTIGMVLGALGSAVLIYLPYLVTIGFRQLWDFQVSYVRKFIVGGVPFTLGLPVPPHWSNLLSVGPVLAVYSLVLLIYPIALWISWAQRASQESLRVALLAFAGLALAAEVSISPNWLRVYAIAIPALILLVWAAKGAATFRVYVRALLLAAVIASAAAQILSRQLQPVVIANFPGGTAAVSTQVDDKLGWLVSHTSPGQSFFQAAWPGLYLPLRLRNPLFIETLPVYEPTRLEYISRALAELDQNAVRYILWQPGIDQAAGTSSREQQLAAARSYLRRHYRRVHEFPDLDEVWERR